jgi:diacylglycerol kinase family enzyme
VSVAVLVVLIVLTAHDGLYLLACLLAAVLSISALWIAATYRRFHGWTAAGAVLSLAGVVASLLAAGRGAVAVAVVVGGIVVAAALGILALRWEVHRALAQRWHHVPATRRGVILMNPMSGGGTVARLHLVDEARRRGIEPVVLKEGDDLRSLAEAAVTRGADALGVAGGDGSQAVVAAVASERGLPLVCIPAGTRNHFALDLGVDRDDPVGALEAFGPALEATTDLGEVNGAVFVNNVSLGLYARIVASERYRQAKRRTVAEMLPELLGPTAAPFGLSLDGPDGPVTRAQVVQVSNNPYRLSSLAGFGSRAALSTGVLGVVTVSVKRVSDINRLVALEATGHPERYAGWQEWTARDLKADGPNPLAAAVDGEARTFAPPLHFMIRPMALRVRIGLGQPGASPAFFKAPLVVSTLVGLARVVRGRPSGIVAGSRSVPPPRPARASSP